MKERIIRTLVPVFVGAALAGWTALGGWAESVVGATVPALPEQAVTDLGTGVVVGGYYIVVAALEKYVQPHFGWLLGLAKQPQYEGRHEAA